MNLQNLTISQIQKDRKAKKYSSVSLTRAYFEAIKKHNPKLNAYLTLCKEPALRQARASDERLSRGKTKSQLDGIPIAIKDAICTQGVKTTASSNILKNFTPPYSATVIEKLNQAGAVILGKTNLDAFAHGSSTENSDFGVTKNPWDMGRVPGGSSGGSAVAISAGLATIALGSDTGGSIRQPASLCGITGFKPTYGAVSRYGLIAMASSFDQIGPMTATACDARILFEIISGKDDRDATSFDLEKPTRQSLGKKKNFTIGVPKEFTTDDVDVDVKKAVESAIKILEKNGATIKAISLPHAKYALAVYYIIQPTEVASNLARFAGVHFGEARDQFGQEARRRIMLGTFVSSAGYADKYYQKAQEVRALVKEDFDQAFQKVDLIVGPVAPSPAFKIGEKASDPLKMYLSDILTVPVNPAGLPAISIPCGVVKRDEKDLPVGLQIIGPQKADYDVLDLAEYFQDMTDFHLLKPNLA